MEIYDSALEVISTLKNVGYTAYFAGGWVRDYLLKHPSDDIDIATNATPQIIQSLFSKTIPVGINFGIIIVVIKGHEFEVATFRKDLEYQDGRRPSKIEYTQAEEDAKRRDFTINGLFYDPIEDKIFDYVEGKIDLEHKLIKAIGNPHERIAEDRLRMIRAIRYATRFSFTIEEKTKEAILAHNTELFPYVAIERVYQELYKMQLYNTLRPSLLMLHQYGLLQSIFKELEHITYEVLEKRLRPLSYFPIKAPLIAGLLILFDSFTEDTVNRLSDHLKVSNKERSFALFLCHTLVFLNNAHENVELARFYANPFSKTTLEIISALYPEEKEAFLNHHVEKRKRLLSHIERIEQKTPLLQAKDLEALGIKPSPLMGKLLVEAERIAVNYNFTDKNQVIAKLQNSSVWEEK